jgi:DNA polymerase bacteriophage-type
MQTILHADLEYYSPLSIKNYPLDVYAAAEGSKILMAAFAFNDEPVRVWEYHQGPCKELREGLTDPNVMVAAWNVNYERTVLRSKGLDVPIERWLDVMVLARYAGLPGRLKDCASIPMIGVPPEEKTKSETNLINRFCVPDKHGRSTDELRETYADDWQRFVWYCGKDVKTMRHIYNWLLPRFPFPERERQIWILDQKINQRGLPVDVELAKAGQRETLRLIGEAQQKLKEITALDNPNSVAQLLPWMQERGYRYESLGKDFLRQALND